MFKEDKATQDITIKGVLYSEGDVVPQELQKLVLKEQPETEGETEDELELLVETPSEVQVSDEVDTVSKRKRKK